MTHTHTRFVHRIEQIFNFPKQYGVVVAWIPDTRPNGSWFTRWIRGLSICAFTYRRIPFLPSGFTLYQPPLLFPKTETRPISTTVAPFYCPRCLSRTRNKTREEKKRKKKKKEQLVRTAVNDNCFLSRRWIVIRNEGKQVPPRLLLDRRELIAAIRARSSWREFPLKLGEFRRIEQ